MAMRLALNRVDSLPRLAWCARIAEGAGTAEVFHGPWVESWPDRFFEGAWDGDFERGAFADAPVSCGSGGMLHHGGMLFCGPTHNWGRLYSIRQGRAVLVSNSLVFALEQSGESLDLTHARYYFDFLQFFRHGASVPTTAIPTASGNPLYLHQWTNLHVGEDLSCRESRMNHGSPPASFSEHERALREGVSGVLRNASATGRRRKYAPLAMVSEGYDSPASAALAAHAGCTDGITLFGPPGPDGVPEDGTRLGHRLGLHMEGRDYTSFRTQAEPWEAELCAGLPFAQHAPWLSFRDRLEGTLLVTGTGGDRLWKLDESLRLPLGMSPSQPAIPGFSLGEWRLRIGMISFPVPMIQSVHRHAVYRISVSEEMRTWRVGGSYDRPIPRRILEEAGVPRTAFGRLKRAAFYRMSTPESMSPEAWQDFQSFYSTKVQGQAEPRQRTAGPLIKGIGLCEATLLRLVARLPPALFLRAVPLTGRFYRDRLHGYWDSPFLYTFHWGVERIRRRYAI